MAIYTSIQNLKNRSFNRPKSRLLQQTVNQNIPTSFSLAKYVKIIFNQGNLGSCTANAFAGAHCLLQILKFNNIIYKPSRLYFYFKERLLENKNSTIGLTDSGADVIDGLSYALNKGIADEIFWPYILSKYNITPPAAVDSNAMMHKISSYSYLSIDLHSIKSVLFSYRPVLIAMNVFENFESLSTANTGVINMPSGKLLGGHEMYIVGFDDNKQIFTCVNSWGITWGIQGFCYLPYSYILSGNVLELTTFNI